MNRIQTDPTRNPCLRSALLAAAGCLGACFSCGGGDEAHDFAPRGAGETPPIRSLRVASELREVEELGVPPAALAGCNLLLVTLDTTRSDRIACYGNPDIDTPTLDALAAEGVVFSRVTAVAPTTLPAHASILTGLYPVHHGARINGLFRLDETHETLAETMRAAGYRTGAIVSSFVLDSQFGLDQGFDDYDDTLTEDEDPGYRHYRERRADATTDRARSWIRGVARERFFLWVHYFDPHREYRPPEPFATRYARDLYDGEIAYVDGELRRLLDELDALELTERTLVVVVGDHGESLGQHGEVTHGILTYQSTLRIPLILRCGERLGGGVHCVASVSQVDLVPTVRSLLGLGPAPETDGVALNEALPLDRAAFFESLTGAMEHGWEPLLGLRRGDEKYIHSSDPELYDLARDPREETNLIATNPGVAREMVALLEELYGVDLAEVDAGAPSATPTAAEVDELRALGYFGGGGTVTTGRGARGNPREMMQLLRRVEEADQESKSAESGIDELRRVVAEHPDFYPAWHHLGDLYRRVEDLTKAAAALERCLELRPGVPQTLYELALVRANQGRREDARLLLEPLVAQYPGLVRARYLYGTVLGQLGRFAEAAGHLKAAFDLDADYERCTEHLIGAYGQLGRGDEVRGILELRLEADPRSVKPRLALARQLERAGNVAGAEAHLRRGLAAVPEEGAIATSLALLLARHRRDQDPTLEEATTILVEFNARRKSPAPAVLFTLGTLYAEAGRLDEAVAALEQAITAARASEETELAATAEQLRARLLASRGK